MKKSFLAVLLMFVLVLPVLASKKGDKELDLKAGILINPALYFPVESTDMELTMNKPFTVAADFFYFPKENLGLGIGISNVFDTVPEFEMYDVKTGMTNIYLGVKQVLPVEGFLNDVYFLGQLGYGIMRMEAEGENLEPEGGLYWAMGVGVEKNSFLVELLYSVNYTNVSNGGESIDMSYSAIGLNVGYKFSL